MRRAERLGYHRYWFAEHHGRRASFASASPELLIARLAGETERIRLGSGGVLLAHYSALKVAESFRLLETLAPNRIDLGIGRGAGGDEDAELALHGADANGVPYERRVEELLAFLGEGFPSGHPYAHVFASPVIARAPEPWLLGSTGASARIAAEHGLPFAYAHFIKGDGPEIAAAYRAAFRPSRRFARPRVLVAVAAFCSDDARERDDFLTTLALRRAWVRTAADPRPPTVEEARAHRATADEQRYIDETRRLALVASSRDFGPRLEELAVRHGAEEALIVSVTPDYASRTRSYEAIACAYAP